MKSVEYYISLALGVVAALLALLVFTTGRASQSLQLKLNQQQEEINRGSVSQQIGVNLLRESAQMAVDNARVRDLLQRNGVTVTPNPVAAPAPAPAPTKN